MVNGVLASCYPSNDHDLAHLGMAPMRLFPETIQWMFGDDGGFSVFALTNEELGKWILPNGWLIY